MVKKELLIFSGSGLWEIGDLAIGEKISLTITVRGNTVGNISSVARVVADQPDVGNKVVNRVVEVRKIITNSTIVATGDFKVDKPVYLSGVARNELNQLMAYHPLTIVVAGKTYNVITKADGSWSLTINPMPYGKYNFVVSWEGNGTHTGFSNSASVLIDKYYTQTVINTKNIKEGQTAKITVTLKDEFGNPLANKKVIKKIAGKTYTAYTNSKGIATFKVKGLKGKKHAVTAHFVATDYHHGSNHAHTQVVKPRVDLAIVKIKLLHASNKRTKHQVAYYKVTIQNKGSKKSKPTVLLSYHIRKGVKIENKYKKISSLKGGQKKTYLFKYYPDEDYHKYCMHGQYFVLNPKKRMNEITCKNNRVLLMHKTHMKSFWKTPKFLKSIKVKKGLPRID